MKSICRLWIDWLCSVRCCRGNPRTVPLAALEAPLLLRCPAVCVALLLLLLLFAVAIALKIDHQLAVVSTRHTGHTRAIHDDQHMQRGDRPHALGCRVLSA